MAFSDYQAERIHMYLKGKGPVRTIKMMGGLCFMLHEKMLIGLLQDKETGEDVLMVRVGDQYHQEALSMPHALPMIFTGRPMQGMVFVTAHGFDLEEDFEFWLKKALEFNPKAKASKKRK